MPCVVKHFRLKKSAYTLKSWVVLIYYMSYVLFDLCRWSAIGSNTPSARVHAVITGDRFPT
jgi:hypothetical protein